MYPRIVIAGLVSLSSVGASAGTPAGVSVYDATQLALGSYVVVERAGLAGWQSAFSVPGYRTQDEARSALLERAARAGAEGVTNLVCMSQTDSLFQAAGYYCYGNAIKLKQQ